MNILEEIYKKIDKFDTGFTLHYPLLYTLVVGLEAKNIFEFGTGYSTHCILHALDKTNGRLISCDVTHYKNNPNVTDFSIHNKRWSFRHGHSNQIVKNIAHNSYDLILHDGSHIEHEVLIDLNNIYPFLKHNGIIIVHDTTHHDLGPNMMSAVNEFCSDKNLECLTLPYGYGLTIIKNINTHSDSIELTWKKK